VIRRIPCRPAFLQERTCTFVPITMHTLQRMQCERNRCAHAFLPHADCTDTTWRT
jgi:hypothetical protein